MNSETREQKILRLSRLARRIRKDILELALHAGKNGAHLGGSLSSAEIFAVLYGEVMKISPDTCEDPNRDRFILSKGHTSVGLYATLFECGFLTQEDINAFEGNDGVFPAHSLQNRGKGIEISSGSLGMGLSFGLGSALAGKNAGKAYRVFVLMGNGECNEGSIWEAAMLATQQKVDNLIAIVDNNGMQLDGASNNIIDISNIDSIFLSFGWNAFRIDGNSVEQLLEVMERLPQNGKPTVLVADTIKGKGCSFMENAAEYHHASITQEQYDLAIKELKIDGV